MIFSLKKISMAVITIFLICGCVGQLKKPMIKNEYYILEYLPPKIAGLAPIPVVLGVQRFQVAPPYNSNKIIFREKGFKRNAYLYHKWRANPGDLVSYFLARDLQQVSIFKAVFYLNKKLPVSHVLEGTVDEFFEHDADLSWQAVLTITITVMKEMEPDVSKRILFQKTYSLRKSCKQKNPRALAEAMSHAMAEVSERMIKDIYHSLSETK